MSFKQETLKIDFTTAPDPVLFDADLVALHGRMLDARCDDDCDLDCTAAVPEDRRLDAYREFRGMAAADDGETRVTQNIYLLGCVELRERTVDTDDNIIEQTPEFWLGGDGIKVRVCRTFFANTLGLPDARLNALLEPDTFEWFSTCVGGSGGDGFDGDGQDKCNGRSSALQRRGDLLRRQPYTDFVLNSIKHLDKNSLAFVEEVDSDVDVYLDDIIPSAYKNVINHIQTIPRVVSTWVNQENNQEKVQFESSINCHYMYLNYLKKLKTNKKKVSEKQYKKIYNRYVNEIFMT